MLLDAHESCTCDSIMTVTVDSLIAKFGGPYAFARAIAVNPSTATEMKRRQSIPVPHWPKVIAAAAQHGIGGVDSDALMQMHLGKGA
jgi:hypothetical protein